LEVLGLEQAAPQRKVAEGSAGPAGFLQEILDLPEAEAVLLEHAAGERLVLVRHGWGHLTN